MAEEEMQEEAMKMLLRATSEGRWMPRRHMALALFVVLPIFLVFIVAMIILFGNSR